MFRSLLFVPATSTPFVDRAAERGASAIIVDLEDAVLPERKAEARTLANEACRSLAAQGVPVLLRVNGHDPWLAQDLAQAPLECLAAIMLPKVDDAAQVVALARRLDDLEAGRAPAQPLRIAALVESPRGIQRAESIADAHPRLMALAFGSEDFSVAMGVAPTPALLQWPAQALALAAHGAGLECWGLAAGVGNIDDHAGYETSARLARALGFTGAMAVHPRQVAVLNAAFMPSAAEIAWARRVADAAKAAASRGDGAVTLDGRMIDRPVVLRAQRILHDLPPE